MQWNIKPLATLLAISLLPLSPSAALASAGQERGLWVWLHPDVETQEGHERLLAFCTRHGIARIFVEVTFSGDEGAKQLDRQAALRDLLRTAASRGIAVEALDGHREMSLEKCRADTLHRLDLLLAFQKSLPPKARFAGLHYDMEPYLGDRWKNGDEAGVMRETLETMAAIRARVGPETGLRLTYDIPTWYDRHPETLAIEFAGARKNFHEHIQDLSDAVGLMSYRRDAAAVLDIGKAEFAYGRATGKKVYAGLETGALKDEPEITFHGLEPKALEAVMHEIDDAKKEAPEYGGIFLHYYESLKALYGE